MPPQAQTSKARKKINQRAGLFLDCTVVKRLNKKSPNKPTKKSVWTVSSWEIMQMASKHGNSNNVVATL